MKKYTNIRKYLQIMKCIVNCEKNYKKSKATGNKGFNKAFLKLSCPMITICPRW